MGETEIISYEYLFYEVLYLDIPAEVYCIWVFLLKCVVYGILDMMYCMRVFLGVNYMSIPAKKYLARYCERVLWLYCV